MNRSVALQLLRLHRIVFVEVERDDVLKAQTLLPMHANQFFVHARGSAARRQAQHAVPTFSGTASNHRGDLARDGTAGICCVAEYANRNAFDRSVGRIERGIG